ncbi:MAG: branched-chain amino acid ABC transporter permease [Beijerinckiaceae bacterium]
MDFWTIVNAASTGVLTGLVYGLAALGLSVIFGVMKIVNFAHGEIMVLGMYLALTLLRLAGLDPLLSIPIAAAALFVFGYLLQSLLIKRVAHLPDHMQFMLLAALAVILVNACLMVFGPDPQAPDLPYMLKSYAFGNVIIDATRIYAAIAAVAVTTLLYAFFRFTTTGTAIRACADNITGARVVGLNVDRLYALTFGIGTACLGAAGCIMLLIFETQPAAGPSFTLLAFIIVIIGGLGSMVGALVGGVLIGVSEALAALLFQPSLKSAFSFGLLILVLLLKPRGLLGKAA